MSNTNSFDSSVFVDISMMNTWQTNIKDICTEATTNLGELLTLSGSLNDSWQGNSATAFVENYNVLVNEVISNCEKTANFANLLQAVVQTMESE